VPKEERQHKFLQSPEKMVNLIHFDIVHRNTEPEEEQVAMFTTSLLVLVLKVE
jgi:hypothetical protein